MTNAHTAVETILSRRYPFPVVARDGRPVTYANRKQAYEAVARLAQFGVNAFVTARHPFLVGVKRPCAAWEAEADWFDSAGRLKPEYVGAGCVECGLVRADHGASQ